MADPQSTFDKVMATMKTGQPRTIEDAYNDYLAGKLNPQQKMDFENDVNAGHIMLPQGASLKGRDTPESTGPTLLPQEITEKYLAGKLSDQQKADLEHDIKAGFVKLPPSIASQIPGFQEPGGTATEQGIIPAQPEGPSFGERLSGTAQAAGVTVWNGIASLLGTTAASVAGITKSMMDGSYKDSPEAGAAAAGQATQDILSHIMIQPATAEGKRQTAAVGETLGNLMPLVGLPGETAMLSQGARAAMPAVSQIGQEAVAAGKSAAQAAKEGVVAPVIEAAGKAAELPGKAAEAVGLKGGITPETPIAEVGKAAAGGNEAALSELASRAAPDAETVAAAKRLGIEDYLQPDHVTTNQAFREWAQAIKSIPASVARSEEIEGLQAVGRKADEIVSKIGGTEDLSTLDKSVKDNLSANQSKLDGQAEALYKKAENLISPRQKVTASQTIDFLKSMANDVGGVEKLAQTEPAMAKLLNQLDRNDVTYSFLDAQRKQIGQAMQKASGTFKDSESGLLKKVYSTLAGDQENIAKANGDEAFYTYKAAQYATRLKKGVEDDMASLFGEKLDKSMLSQLKGGMGAVTSGDAAKLGKFLSSVPKEMRQQVVASGLNAAFGKSMKSPDFSPSYFSKWFDALKNNKQSYAAVMSNLPEEARGQLADLATVSDGIAKASRERISTGRISAIRDQITDTDGLISKIHDLAGKGEHFGVPGAGLIRSAMSMISKDKTQLMSSADRLITSKAFRDSIQPIEQGNAEAAVAKLKSAPELVNLLNKLKLPSNIQFREKWLMDMLKFESVNHGKEDAKKF